MTCIDQASDTEWCTVRNSALSRSSNLHSSARSNGTSRALIEPASTSRVSSWTTRSLDGRSAGGRSLTSSGTRHGGNTAWQGGSASLTTTVRSSS